MSIEFEAKVLNVDPSDIAKRVLAAGGTLVEPRRLMRRHVFDVVAGDPSQWVRLRDTGSETTLTHKRIRHSGIDGVDEIEIVVDDFEAANQLLEALGYTAKARQENYRTSYSIGSVAVEADEWPGVPAYVEIEGGSRNEVVRTAERLGFTAGQLTSVNTAAVYEIHGVILSSISDLRFDATEAGRA